MAPARRPQLLWAAVVVLLLPAAPGALGLACTDTSACPANQCCNTFATAPFSCVAGPFVGGVQVCSCVGLEAKGLKCPADKPYCCGTSGLCVADVATCTCTDSTTCPKGSCCSKPSADWASATSLGTCSLAPFSADGKYCQCSPVAKLNGVACPACCKLDNRCSAQATDCDCYKAFQCPKGSCCSRRDWFRNVRGKCSTEFSSADGSFCKCSEGMNGVACTYCCFPTGLCTASYEACPCSGSYDCVDNNYKYAGCCSKTLAQWKGADSGRGYCSRQLLGGPSDDAFCDCAEAVAHGVSCPASSQAGPVATCCILRGVWPDLSKCEDSCPCDPVKRLGCPSGQCCTYTPEAGSGICMTNASDASGNQVCPDCNSFAGQGKYGASECPPGKAVCCPNGQCAAFARDCGCTKDSECLARMCCNKETKKCSSALTYTSGNVTRQICKTCARAGMSCPTFMPYCCKNGKCAASLEDCNCRYTSECQKGSCCARPLNSTVGKCSTTMFKDTTQICPNCNRAVDNGMSCPAGMDLCCPDGKCVGTAGCGKMACYIDWDCPADGQCCGSDGYCRSSLFDGTVQSCSSCIIGSYKGVWCPKAKPYCCPRGQCAAKAADCDFTVNAVRVSKYQAHHLYYLDALANLTATADNTIWNGGKYKRPSPGDYYDFRGFVEVGSPDENGLPLACRNRYDNSTGTSFRGLDLKTAAGPLAWAADVAAQLWFSECKAITQCKADMAKDDVTLADMKQWTKLAGDRILSYLQIAPGGRNLLCPPRAYFGFFYQTFVRPPSPQASFFGLFNWATALTPSLIRIKNSAGAEEMVSALQLLQRNAELSLYIPEPLFAMEGLIELLIGQDHSLVQSFPPPILPASTPAFAFEPALTEGAPAAVDGAAPEATPVVLASTDIPAPEAAAAASALAPADAVAAEAAAAAAAAAAALAPADSAPALAVGAPALDTAPASEVVAPVEAMDAGPVAPASYAENGFVAGLANPELLNLAVGTTWAAGCAVDNVRCAAKSLGLLGAQSEAAGAAPAGAVAELAGDGAQIMGGNKTCLMQMRTLQLRLQSAKDMCTTYRSAGAWVHPDPAQRVFAIERPIWDIQIEKGYAVYAYACSLMPEPALKYCKMSQSSLEDYMEKYSAMLATMRSITCDTAATSYRHVNVLGDGKAFPVIRGGGTGGGCTKVASNFISDVGCTLVDFVYDRYNAAVECCAGDCSTRPECALFSGGLATRINIPSCGGDGDPASFVKMPAGFAMPAASGAACGGGDGKGYWGWGVWSA